MRIAGLDEFLEKHPLLGVTPITGEVLAKLKGKLHFHRYYENGADFHEIKDSYELEITIPSSYPHELPTVKEVAGKIPRKDYNHVNPDGTLCIGSPVRQRQSLIDSSNLNDFIEEFLVPFLFACSVKQKYNINFLFGELAHGAAGEIDDYKEMLGVQSIHQVIDSITSLFLRKRIANKKPYPCGCGIRLGKCNYHFKLNSFRKIPRNFYQKTYDYLTETEPYSMFTKIDTLQAKLNSFRPLPKHTLKSLHEQFVLEWTYNSNAIEGNTLTLKETKVVLEGITIGGKSMREHFEAINHKEAIDYVEAIVSNDEPFNEHVIKSIHQLILKDIDNDNAGVYRKENVLIAGAEHTPPDHILVTEQMTTLLKNYNQFKGHPLERAARLHIDFVKIHPFVDGNGRTARLLMNLDLMKAGLQPVVIKTLNRLSYYEALDKAHTQNQIDDFLLLVSNAEEEALNKVLALVDGHS